jgi:hypothetical protein
MPDREARGMIDYRDIQGEPDGEDEAEFKEAMSLYLQKYGVRFYHNEQGEAMMSFEGVDKEAILRMPLEEMRIWANLFTFVQGLMRPGEYKGGAS